MRKALGSISKTEKKGKKRKEGRKEKKKNRLQSVHTSS
jgi:hypothetical protein